MPGLELHAGTTTRYISIIFSNPSQSLEGTRGWPHVTDQEIETVTH